MSPIFFSNQNEFRDWLDKNHKKERELWVGYYRVATGKPSMTWSESVDQALCFGWIDGIRKKVDDESYSIRFTPRKPGSKWSKINIAKVEEMIKQGLMKPAGLEAYKLRKENKSGIYSFENEIKDLPEEYVEIFKKNTEAWEFYSLQTASYRRTITHWVLSAKQEKTRISRLARLIFESEAQNRIFGQNNKKTEIR
jgi:uncharacterized protein YdeI (YjbR/CyaY-like superfamily)